MTMPEPEQVTREILWNIPTWARASMYALFAVAVVVFAYGIWRRIRLWRTGQAEPSRDPLRQRLGRLCKHGLVQTRIWRSRMAGLSHAGLFAAFVVLTVVTLIVAVEDYRIAHLFYGTCYLVLSFAADLFGVVLVFACLLAIARRKLDPRFKPPARPVDVAVLWCVLLIGVSGFVIEGLRIAATGPQTHGFETVAFVGWTLAGWLQSIDASTARGWHLGLWLFHMALTMAFIAAIPYTKLRHILFAPANLLLAHPPIPGKYPSVSIEQVEETGRYGVETPADFNWRQLLSFDACTQCARCASSCPAHTTDKPLSPMKVVLDVASALGKGVTLTGETVSADVLWACTSCGACVHECPVLIDQLGAIVEMRRYLVGQGEIRGQPQAVLRAIEGVGNPWGLPPDERDAWTRGLDVPTVADVGDPDVLFWVGCAGSYDRRGQDVSRALVKILEAADVKFAILGNREKCTGDPPRRMGDEFTFQAMAQSNIDTLREVNSKRIVTACPHCFNTFRNEYPDLGANFDVVHHTQLIDELIRGGRLKLDPGPAKRTTFHDSCYLGRQNHEYDAPRASLRAAGSKLAEIPASRESGFCCGAGGGRMWMEEDLGSRINHARWDQLGGADPQVVAVSCPFCMTMLGDAAADAQSEVEVKDVAQIVADRIVTG